MYLLEYGKIFLYTIGKIENVIALQRILQLISSLNHWPIKNLIKQAQESPIWNF